MKNTHRSICILLLGVILLSACTSNTTEIPPAAVVTEENQSVPLPGPTWTPVPVMEPFTVYFSNPDGKGEPQADLVKAINSAQYRVDVAVMSLSLPDVCDALSNAQKRGVEVRLVIETESLDSKCPKRLKSEGILIVDDRQKGLMHDKFAIIDKKEVWTGSMNYTLTSAYDDHNNLLRIQSPEIAALYEGEFEEMYTEYLFGPGGNKTTTIQPIMVNGHKVEAYFSPEDKIAGRILKVIASSRKSINIQAFAFTRDDLGDEIIRRAKAGVNVRGVFDSDQIDSNIGGEFPRFLDAGLDVHRDPFMNMLHDKLIIIDGEIIITGSYNFSNSAETKNDENVVIIWDAQLAAQYEQEFEKIYQRSK
ncbi:MAG: DUF1669 domain-containing protein [Anaerolineaceae bacterium]|nr:DUF1669 domain-containing protein [Anaerolineaceae bacterium]